MYMTEAGYIGLVALLIKENDELLGLLGLIP